MTVTLIILTNVRCQLLGLDKRTTKLIDEALSIEQPGARFQEAVRMGRWDGRRHLFYAASNTFPKGLLQRVQGLLTEAGVNFEIDDQRVLLPPPDLSRLKEDILSTIVLRPYQMKAVRKSLKAGCGIVWMATNCLVGDTKLVVNRGGGARTCDLRTIVARFNGEKTMTPQGRFGWDPSIPTYTQSVDENGYLHKNQIVAAHDNGVHRVYEITTDTGKQIRATRNHRFLTPDGTWLRLHELQSGDEVCVLTWPKSFSKNLPRADPYRYVRGLHRHPHATVTWTGRRQRVWRNAEHTLVAEAQLNQMSYAKFIGRVFLGQLDGLQFLDPKVWHVHHKNGVRGDNRRGNLEVLPIAEHLRQHGVEEGWKHVAGRTGVERIVSIQRGEKEHVYDLTMADPYHNYVANQFVVHNSGKSAVASAMMRVLKERRCLFLVPKRVLLNQTRAYFATYFNTIEEHIGVIGEGRFEPKHITVATVQSLTHKGTPQKAKVIASYLKTIELVFLDEGHKARANTWFKLMNRIPAQYRYILSGTPFGSGNGLMVEAAVGPVVARISNKTLIKLGVSAVPTIKMIEITTPKLEAGSSWPDVYRDGIVHNEVRNTHIATQAAAFAKDGKPTLILVKELWHGDLIGGLLKNLGVKYRFVHGKMASSMIEREKVRFEEGKFLVLIASAIFDEGVSIPEIRALIPGDGGKSVRSVLQRIGRGLRKKAGENVLDVVDFVDLTNPWLADHSQQRLEIYLGEGFRVIT